MCENLYKHLIENEAILREVMHIAKIGSWKWDLKTKDIVWSDEMYEIFDIEKSSVNGRLGDSISKVIHPDDLKIFQDVNNISKKIPFEYRVIHADKSIHYILAKAGDVICDEQGNPSFLIGIVQDITEQKIAQLSLIKAKEEAENENATKSHFFATMSHEFRTPITVLISSVQLFELYLAQGDDLKKDKITKHIRSMKQSSLRLLRLVNNLIDISKIDTGFYSTNFNNYNIVDIIEKIVMSVRDYANQRNINIVFKSSIDEAIIRCDIDMIERIMLNLISNAFKFSNVDCFIQISVSRQKGFIVVGVKDNGIGIDKDKIFAIFERYNQVQTTLSKKSEGSGIGLSITKSLVEMHNGQLSVKSKPGKGSEFIIKIPDVMCPVDQIVIKNNDNNDNDDQNIVQNMKVEFSDIYF